jgi:SM-20-related protein
MIQKYENIIDQIAEKSFGVIDDFLNEAEIKAINQALESRYLENKFKTAGISKNSEIITEIRGDEIFWLDKSNSHQTETNFLEKVEHFISYLNETCFLGLRSYEIHYAVYQEGKFYKRHLDKFKINSNRKLSFICYLNENWKSSHGGELVLYLEDEDLKLAPIAGRLVIFESDKIEHEVLPTYTTRKSLTGWLKTS